MVIFEFIGWSHSVCFHGSLLCTCERVATTGNISSPLSIVKLVAQTFDRVISAVLKLLPRDAMSCSLPLGFSHLLHSCARDNLLFHMVLVLRRNMLQLVRFIIAPWARAPALPLRQPACHTAEAGRPVSDRSPLSNTIQGSLGFSRAPLRLPMRHAKCVCRVRLGVRPLPP